jgi:Flp pilus assembly protein TadG
MDRKFPSSLSRNRRRAGVQRRSGVAVVEAALLLPVALILMLGTWEVGRMVEVTQILTSAAREGGRSASTSQYTNSQVQQTVLNYLQNAGLPSASATVTVSDLTNPNTDCTAATELDRLQVTVSIPFNAVRWSSALLVSNNSSTLTATTIYYSNNDQSYPTSITMPPAY